MTEMEKFPSLSDAEAEKRLKEDGENILQKPKKRGKLAVFLGQYKDIMTVILLISTVISFFMGEYAEAIAIAVIVLLNSVLGFVQEYRAERSLEALNELAAPMACVVRGGKLVKLDAKKIVRGDLLLLSAGDRIPADAVVLKAAALESDESVLSGESLPAAKESAPDYPLQNKLNDPRLVYAGCTVTRGHGIARVVDIGQGTQMGRIAHLLNEAQPEGSPLSKKLDHMGKIIAAGCLIVCAVVTLCGILRGEDVFAMLVTGVSLAVAAVPEGLAAIVTISLAVTVSRMRAQNALVRKLHAVETLGCAGVICTDKTGTLTENHMTAVKLFTFGSGEVEAKPENITGDCKRLLHAAAGCCKERYAADPTETALLDCAARCGEPESKAPVLKELPFDSVRKRMSTLVAEPSGRVQYTKGAPDYLLPLCSRACLNGKIVLLNSVMREKIRKALTMFGESALRCICVAYREGNDICEDDLTFLGLFGMIDPPRKGVKKAVSSCREAGIRLCMVTGDYAATASKIAKDIGILRPGDLVMTGEELEEIPVAALQEKIGRVTVFARVSPAHKLKIVKAFEKRGQICAMTGDGVNDAPALRQADIGVSMGKNGTDVARQASDIVLLDDNFATLVQAVREGRGVYDNIRKFLRYLLSCNIGEVLTMFLGLLLGFPVVLLPLQILLVNLVTDGLPAIALGLEPVEDEVMKRRPRAAKESIFSNGLGFKIIFRGICIGITTPLSFWWALSQTGDLTTARTAALFTLVTAQLIHVFECKSERVGLFSVHYGNNLKLVAAVAFSFAVLLAVIYLPAAAALFGVAALPLPVVGSALLCAAAVPVVSSILHIKRRRD